VAAVEGTVAFISRRLRALLPGRVKSEAEADEIS